MIYTLLFFILGFVVSVFCTPWVIRLAHRGIGLDYAHESRKKQGGPISRLWGMTLMLAVSVGLPLRFAVVEVRHRVQDFNFACRQDLSRRWRRLSDRLHHRGPLAHQLQ